MDIPRPRHPIDGPDADNTRELAEHQPLGSIEPYESDGDDQ